MTILTSMHPCTSCCKTKGSFFNSSREVRMEKAFHLIEKISVIALGILAAITAPELFLPTFAFGALIGMFTHQKHAHHHHNAVGGGCSHGYLEQRLGIELPKTLELAAGFAVMATHIDHHAEVFVPITGVILGMWTGNLVASSLHTTFRSFSVY